MSEFHPIPYQSKIREKFITLFGIGLSLTQAAWWAVGGMLSYQMSRFVPRIGDDWFYSRLHYAIPLGICLLLCHGMHGPTGLSLWRYALDAISIRMRPRKFSYRKTSCMEGG